MVRGSGSALMAAELQAGREMNALVAQAMGWTVELIIEPRGAFEEWRDANGRRYGADPPPFSSEIAFAWQVVEHFGTWTMERDATGEITCHVNTTFLPWGGVNDPGPYGTADTAPLAICRAALAAVA